MEFIDLGFCDYKIALEKQKEVWAKRVNGEINDTLILVEHPAVFTLGKSGKEENLLVSKINLQEKNIPIYRVERGGDITFHGPGQIVGYPIFKLKNSLVSVRRFIYKIEEILIEVLKEFNIVAQVSHPNIGVWVGNKKIASIGLAVSKQVTFHGFALNVSTELDYFNYINPCGMRNIKMTSMQEILQKPISMDSVKEKIQSVFSKYFI
ncbi:MAG: lipoyl(octanoyl) transferase LipB [candidate division WOR-3 bacterium]